MLTGAEPLDRARLGSMHHVALVVPDIQKALETVRSRPGGWDRQTVRNPQVGRNRRWQLNLFDPDGSPRGADGAVHDALMDFGPLLRHRDYRWL